MNAHRDCSSISLFSLNPLDVDHKFLTITLNHFANLLSLVVTTNNLVKYSQLEYHFVKVNNFGCTWTSSSLRMGMFRMLYFCLSSLDRGAVIRTRLSWDGALKWRLRFLRREELTRGLNFIVLASSFQLNPANLKDKRRLNKIRSRVTTDKTNGNRNSNVTLDVASTNHLWSTEIR